MNSSSSVRAVSKNAVLNVFPINRPSRTSIYKMLRPRRGFSTETPAIFVIFESGFHEEHHARPLVAWNLHGKIGTSRAYVESPRKASPQGTQRLHEGHHGKSSTETRKPLTTEGTEKTGQPTTTHLSPDEEPGGSHLLRFPFQSALQRLIQSGLVLLVFLGRDLSLLAFELEFEQLFFQGLKKH